MERKDCMEFIQVKKQLGKFSLDEISLELPMGYVIGLIGQNGAGKTTLLQILLGLYKPDYGEVKIFGMDYAEHEKEIRQQIGVVLQDQLFLPEDTLIENADYYGVFFEQYDKKLLLNHLEEFGLDPKRKYKNLSKGEELKFQFAFALSHKPRILVLDEATGNFDPSFREKFLSYVKEYIADGEKGVILSTHLTEELEQIADYIVYLEKGKILFMYDIEQLRTIYRIVVGEEYKINLLPKDKIIGLEKGKLATKALIRYRKNVKYDKELTLLTPTLEELMYFITKREKGRYYEF